jgi:hypothetical protein
MTVRTCLHHAVEIQRHVAPRDWPRALERVPAECRGECEEYLRGIAMRMRAQRAIKPTRVERNQS